MAIPEISNIWSQYQLAMEEFKEVHRSNESAKEDGNKARELRNDIGAIETEIENGITSQILPLSQMIYD